MKFKFSLKDKEVSMEADVEKLVEKGMDQKEARPDRKTRYQIKQEEKRKNAELKHKQKMQEIYICIGILAIIIVICLVMAIFFE